MKRPQDHLWLNLISCFLIPGYTLLFAGSVQWFSSNFSVLAVTGADYYRGFVCWGLLTGSYFLVMLNRLAGILPHPAVRLWVRLLTGLAMLALLCAITIPYLPSHSPRYAALHVLLAALSCVLLMLDLLIILLSLYQADPLRWKIPLGRWLLITVISALLFCIPVMVSTALEVFFVISVTLLVRDMWLRKVK